MYHGYEDRDKEAYAINASWSKILSHLKLPFRVRLTGTIVIRCPFHTERTPSCMLWPKSGRFHCHGCGHDGDKIDFLCGFYTWRYIPIQDFIASLPPFIRAEGFDCDPDLQPDLPFNPPLARPTP